MLWKTVEVPTGKGLLRHPSGWQKWKAQLRDASAPSRGCHSQSSTPRPWRSSPRQSAGGSSSAKGHGHLAAWSHILHLPSQRFHLLEAFENCLPLASPFKERYWNITVKSNFQCYGISGICLSLCLGLDLYRWHISQPHLTAHFPGLWNCNYSYLIMKELNYYCFCSGNKTRKET